MTAPTIAHLRGEGRLSRLVERWVPARLRGPTGHRVAFVVAAALFVGALVFSIRRLPTTAGSIHWPLLVTAVLGGAVALLLANTLEYVTMAWLCDRSVSMRRALRVAVLGAATNLLPVPGGVLVRATHVRRLGASYATIAGATLVLGVSWVAVTAFLAGAALALSGVGVLAWAVTGAGAVGLAVASMMFRKGTIRRASVRRAGAVFAIETAIVCIAAARFLGILTALQIDVDLGQAFALTFAGVVATATGFFPGGLGIREAASGVIGAFVGIEAAAATGASVFGRIGEFAVLIAASMWAARQWPRTVAEDASRV